jgi:S-adenosylmethionine-diacylglycerol 3-amino-3-carboxypropyl transferase
MNSHIGTRADFSRLRYAQCWEDADLLIRALKPPPESTLLSIASGGDNSLALLTMSPRRVVALDLSAAQIAMTELRIAAYRRLDHPQLLELMGARTSPRRHDLYERCRPSLSSSAQSYWDGRSRELENGVSGSGRFERYLALFGTRILPLIHPCRVRMQLLRPQDRTARETFYREVWDTWRWRLLFRVFFARPLMARMGRAPEFLAYAEGDVAARVLARTRYALTELDPSRNPYLQWILLGRHGPALPCALRPENFQIIRDHLDRLEVQQTSVEAYLDTHPGPHFHGFNLSDIFEYMDLAATRAVLERLADAGHPGARLVYWNVFAARRRPPDLAHRLAALEELSTQLHLEDRAFFYSALIVEEVL